MSTADQYRAFARECIRWANGATNIEHREAFLDMATHWAEAAARLDHQHALSDQFDHLIQDAKRPLGAERAKSSANGGDRTESPLAHRDEKPGSKSLS
jgi:hypothetical protein